MRPQTHWCDEDEPGHPVRVQGRGEQSGSRTHRVADDAELANAKMVGKTHHRLGSNGQASEGIAFRLGSTGPGQIHAHHACKRKKRRGEVTEIPDRAGDAVDREQGCGVFSPFIRESEAGVPHAGFPQGRVGLLEVRFFPGQSE